MTDENNSAPAQNSNGAEGQAASANPPSMRVLAQYVKDLSFENPGAPDSLMNTGEAPKMSASVNVQASQRSNTDFECEIHVSVTSKNGENTVFIVELVYAGLVQLQNIPQEQIQQILLIEAPRQLFPFARRVVSDATRDGGFPPLLLDPIDFAALYQQRMMAAQQQAAAEQAEGGETPSEEAPAVN